MAHLELTKPRSLILSALCFVAVAGVVQKEMSPISMTKDQVALHSICKVLDQDFWCDHWWLVELPMWLTDGISVTFFGRWRGAVRIHVSHVQLTCVTCSSHVANYYMVERSPHVWLTCVTCVMCGN